MLAPHSPLLWLCLCIVRRACTQQLHYTPAVCLGCYLSSRPTQNKHPQVRTIFPVGANRHQAPCTQHTAFAYSLLGPGSHACANVGRDHRSNNVFYVLDFSCVGNNGGVFCQKCYDPDCRGYRSPWSPLPPEVWQQQRLLAAAAAWRERQQEEAAAAAGGQQQQ